MAEFLAGYFAPCRCDVVPAKICMNGDHMTMLRRFPKRLRFAIPILIAVIAVPMLVVTNGFGRFSTPRAKAAGTLFVSTPSAIRNADRRLELFAAGTDHALWHNFQTSPGGSWSGWGSLGAPAGVAFTTQPAVALNSDGRIQVFETSTRNPNPNDIWTNAQVTPGGGWSGWASLGGGWLTIPAVANNADGRLEIFAQSSNDLAVWHNFQLSPGGSWSGWSSLGTTGQFAIGTAAAFRNSDGRVEVFEAGAGSTGMWQDLQTSPGGAWSGWSAIGGPPAVGIMTGTTESDIAVGFIPDGGLLINVTGSDGQDWSIFNNSSGGAWSAWGSWGGSLRNFTNGATDFPVFGLTTSNGWVDTFAHYVADDALRFISSPWPTWASLGGGLIGGIAVGTNADGRLQVFVVGLDGQTIFQNTETIANNLNSWSGFSSLGAP